WLQEGVLFRLRGRVVGAEPGRPRDRLGATGDIRLRPRHPAELPAVRGLCGVLGVDSRGRAAAAPGSRAPGLRITARTTISLMCRNIKTLYNFEPPTTHDEMHAAAEQY